MAYLVLGAAAGVTFVGVAALWTRPESWWHGWRCLTRFVPVAWATFWAAAALRMSHLVGSQPLRLALVFVPALLVILFERPRWAIPPGVR